MGKFDQFNYWRKGVNLNKPKLKVKPQGGKEHLIYYQILNGDFNESPYWKMAEENQLQFEKEKADWKERNPKASKMAYEDWEINRRKMWNKQIIKLKETHQKYETEILQKLEKELNNAFGFDFSPFNFENFKWNMEELYQKYKSITK